VIPQVPQRTRRGRRAAAAGLALATLVLAGCTQAQQRGFMPGPEDGQEVTNQTERITSLWTGAWLVLVLVGLIVWGLSIWCAIAYRRRKNDTGFPIQLRYHVPLELMFTLVPVVMVLTFFYFTARDTHEIEYMAEPDYTVNIVGKQWSWDFNYVDDNVHEPAGIQSFATGEPGAAEMLPVLYLPVDQTVEFRLDSRDVAHSFWVVDFLYKKDMIPGFTNTFQVTPTREGTYAGKCAELCGEYHSDMLFNVIVVSQEEFDAHMQDLRDQGYEGQLGVDLNRNQQEWSMREENDDLYPHPRQEDAENEGANE
jgi:cytochrome c oxidase subunit 2